MPYNKASLRMNELILSVQQALAKLEEGKLALPELEQCTDDARAVYERLVVLRHKAREAFVEASKQAANAEAEAVAAAEVAKAPIRLDTRPETRPAEPPPHQTSLIDAIAESETPPVDPPKPVATQPAPVATPPLPKVKPAEPPVKATRSASVADRMEHAQVADLRKAIALSQKFWFVAELFGGERDRYEKAIDALNAMVDSGTAEDFVRNEVLGKLAKAPGEEVGNAFMDLVQRRFR